MVIYKLQLVICCCSNSVIKFVCPPPPPPKKKEPPFLAPAATAMYLHLNKNLVQCTYRVHTCFYIVLIFKIKYIYVITSAINFCNYMYNYTVDPSLTP